MLYYIKKNWRICSLVCFLGIITSAMFTSLPLLLMNAFNALFERDFQTFLFWTLINTAGWIVYLGLVAIRGYWKARAVQRLNNHVRHDLYLSLLAKDHTSYHASDSGEYISWLTNNVKQIETLAWVPFFAVATYVSEVLFSLAAVLTLHWSLAIVATVSTLVMWFVPKLFEKRLQKLGEACSRQQAQAVSRMKDILSGLDVLRSFGRTDRFLRQGDEASDQMEQPSFRLSFNSQAIDCVVSFCSILMQVLSDIFIALLAFSGAVTFGTLGGGSNLIANVSNGLSNLASNRLSLITSKPYFEKITVHADSFTDAPKAGPGPLRDTIELEDLSFSYGGKPILKDLSLRFEKGGKYALTGPSGCGKSTLLKLLLGWLPDYEGRICFDGRDARDFTPEQLQQQMSYIEQNVYLFNTTIRENITLGDTFTEEQLNKALRNSALEFDLANMPLGLDTPVGEDGSSLSGGQKQRVAIARALIHNRSILLVDEGTSALDQKNADIVEKSLLSNPELTLILVSHHLTPQRKTQFDRVFELKPVSVEAAL